MNWFRTLSKKFRNESDILEEISGIDPMKLIKAIGETEIANVARAAIQEIPHIQALSTVSNVLETVTDVIENKTDREKFKELMDSFDYILCAKFHNLDVYERRGLKSGELKTTISFPYKTSGEAR